MTDEPSIDTNKPGFRGRRILVAGGTKGVGLAVARRLVVGGGTLWTPWNRNPSPPRHAGAERSIMFRTPMGSMATLVLAAVAFAGGTQFGRDVGAPPALAAEPAPQQLYELRIYTAAPGRTDALHARFRDHTLRLFGKHGIKSVGYWTGADEAGRDKLYYVVAYPDRRARERMLVNGIAKDPEFLKAVAESEKGGKLTAGVESVLLTPTDYSPIR